MRVIDSPVVMCVGLTMLGLTPREVATILGTTVEDVRGVLKMRNIDPDNLPTALPDEMKDTLLEDAMDAPYVKR